MKFILLILLFLSLQSQAQIINASSPYRVRATASCAKLLDTYSGAAAAYSLRKLDCDYTGYAIKVRRSSDNAEQDIGFTANGDLDTASLKTFVSTNSGYVTTWYDQSGNTNNATQTTAGNQPRIVNAGTVERLNGLPAVNIINSADNYFSITGVAYIDFTFFTVTKKNTTAVGGSVILYQLSSIYAGDDVDNTGNPMLFVSMPVIHSTKSNTSASGGETSQHLSYYNRNSDQSSGGLNGEVKTEATVTTTTITPSLLFRYSAYLPYSYDGYVQEIIMYNSDKKANRSAIEGNINTYYSIY